MKKIVLVLVAVLSLGIGAAYAAGSCCGSSCDGCSGAECR